MADILGHTQDEWFPMPPTEGTAAAEMAANLLAVVQGCTSTAATAATTATTAGRPGERLWHGL